MFGSVKAAHAAYDELTPEQREKAGSTVLEKLTAAESAWATAYDTAQKATAEGLGRTGDSEAATALIIAAKNAIDTIPYNPGQSLDDYQKAVDAIITKLGTDLDNQRAADGVSTQITTNVPAADDVATSDKAAIEAARAAYNELNEEQKAKLPTDTLAKLEAAEAARKAYDALTDEQKAMIPAASVAKLQAAEVALVEATDQEAADDAASKVDVLPAVDKVATSDKAAIEAARKACDALTSAQKARSLPAR